MAMAVKGRRLLLLAMLVCMLRVSSSDYVGNLIRNKLSLQLDGRSQSLQLDLNAQISTLNCTGHQSKPVFGVSLTINRTDGSNPTRPATIRNVKFACSPHSHQPVAALGPGQQSLSTQLLSPLRNKIFTYCLSSTSSNIFFGSDQINFMPNKRPISPLLQFTPLLPAGPRGQPSYRIQLVSLKFNGSRLPVNPQPVALSSTEPYTRLARPAYVAVRDAFRRLTIQRVPPVAPFDTCFNASALGSTRVGPGVPQVELQLAGNVTWTLFGANTMVFLNADSVACVAFLDAGPPPAATVIGEFQQRDNLIRFDLDKRRFGFTGILYFFQTTCSNFNSTLA